MKPFARINLSSAALRRGSGKCCQCESVANTKSNCQWTALAAKNAMN